VDGLTEEWMGQRKESMNWKVGKEKWSEQQRKTNLIFFQLY